MLTTRCLHAGACIILQTEMAAAIDDEAVRARVRVVVLEMAPVQPPGAALTSATRMGADLGYDSLRVVEVAVALEDEFGLDGGDEDDVTDVETVGDVEDRVIALLREQAAP